MRKFFRMVTVTIIAAISCEAYAQHSPVGIVSAQDIEQGNLQKAD